MWQIYGEKVTCGTKGGLVSGWKQSMKSVSNNEWREVNRNNRKRGIDGMQVDELLPFLRRNQEALIQEVREGGYKPNPVRRVEIPRKQKASFESWEFLLSLTE